MTRVLPEPAPARIKSGPSPCVTAARWSSVRSASRSPGSDIGLTPSAAAAIMDFDTRILPARADPAKVSPGTRLARKLCPMDVVGIGTQVMECARVRRLIETHGDVFLRQVYTDRETSLCNGKKHSTEHFTAIWAAKEAVLRSLGTSWKRGGNLTAIEVVCEDG